MLVLLPGCLVIGLVVIMTALTGPMRSFVAQIDGAAFLLINDGAKPMTLNPFEV
jgi:hypothetical protein